MEEETKEVKADYSINWLVFWVLVILTAGEFYLGVNSDGRAAAFMFAFAFLKAVFIVINYMGIGRVFGRRREDH